MNEADELPEVDQEALAAFIEQNRQDRLAYVRWKVQWMREHGQIIDP